MQNNTGRIPFVNNHICVKWGGGGGGAFFPFKEAVEFSFPSKEQREAFSHKRLVQISLHVNHQHIQH